MAQPRRVEFTSAGETLAADLYLPEGGEGPLPIVVMAGGWCYVKELIQPHYGKFFNDAGFATLIFDYARFGDSTGEPRQHIDPNSQIEDYRNAIRSSPPRPRSTRSASASGASRTPAGTRWCWR